MGLRTAAPMCERMTSALVYIHALHDFSCVNYVDDLAGVAHVDQAGYAFQNLVQIITVTGFIEATERLVNLIL